MTAKEPLGQQMPPMLLYKLPVRSNALEEAVKTQKLRPLGNSLFFLAS